MTDPEPEERTTRDLFAELYVAGVLSDAGWHVYFPKRDFGFDFIVTKQICNEIIVRPVQVKGKYPTAQKGDVDYYGYIGRLTQIHPEMVLAIPYFTSTHSPAPEFTAFMPRGQIRARVNKPEQFTVLPCRFMNGLPVIRRNFRKFFGNSGLKLMESLNYKSEVPERILDTESDT